MKNEVNPVKPSTVYKLLQPRKETLVGPESEEKTF